MLVFATTFGNNHYLNIASLSPERIKSLEKSNWEPSMAEGYFLAKYEVSGDKLMVAMMDPEQKKQAVKSGKIKGAIKDNRRLITDTTENLARFIASADQEKLFPSQRTPQAKPIRHSIG